MEVSEATKALLGTRIHDLEPEDLEIPATSEGFEITPEIFISHWIPAHNERFLKRFGIRSILCLDGTLKPGQAEILGVERIVTFLNFPDGPGTTLTHVSNAVASLRELVASVSPVLVHCNAGQSRSPSIVAAFLATERGYSLDEAIRFVVERRRPQREVKIWKETREVMEGFFAATEKK